MIWTHTWLSLFHYSWSFDCVSFHVITWLLSFYCQDYVFHAHVLSSLIPALSALHRWSRLWWCMSPQKLFFCYHLPTWGRAGVKLGDAWYVSNISIIFYAPCLFFTPFALCFITLRGIFMRFLDLTYWQDAAVPVPCFLLFLCFRKATQEIFLELDETSSETPIFPRWRTKTEREPEGGQRLATP
jgi:hypothetical protein